MTWPDLINSTCRENYTYFDSSDYLRNAYHVTAIFTVPLSILTFYIILKKTPSRMEPMKMPLLISHASSTNLDLMFTVYSAPYIFFPTASGTTLGVLGRLGVGVKWQAYWGQVSVLMLGVSFIMLYENRQSQISTVKFKIKRKETRILYYAANYLFSFTVMVSFYIHNSDQVELRKFAFKKIPCPTIEFFDSKTYVLLKSGEVIPLISTISGFVCIGVQTFFFLFHTIYHLTCVGSATVSESAKKLQRMFLKIVSVQISIPLIAIVLPVLYSMYADNTSYYNQAANNNAMIVMANHGLLSTCCTLLIYKPYRDFIMSKFIF
ncbi:Serpentine Receptor, class H [Caenorhabditis elegans]|uniref:Serpentine Receptor, class H n=1 Tax=Caenorhabditis elegans TaxID=6239 RepID=G5EDM6_CAEEL|nr:Serpentine Receptor, class H [Caenorhabditis elegans]NP_494591.1 Serpentine Receptor, class H [Caenorhabditis elegans]CCD70924.1 Serpentine Receptor, class H [Caenorhabditis elegans]CCD70925.1 Serpentine Receptor, class H [Caenorhabditis elegans]|eukprot:NP_494590.1 Serpentine Receptor, class H [Caenorhabditis elegans]